jgi:hypothetical protein
MNKKQKDSLIEYMMKYRGMSYRNAMMKFEKWANDRLHPTVPTLNVAEGKKMTKEKLATMVIYMYRKGFTINWIIKSLDANIDTVKAIIKKHEESL